MEVDVLDRHLLLALAAMLVECVEKRRPSAGELVRLIEALAPHLKSLSVEYGESVALHCGVVGGYQLGGHHAFEFVAWSDAHQRRNCGTI